MARSLETDMTPLVEAYLLIDQPRQRLGHWTAALAALDSPEAPPLASVLVLYDPTTDQALINLRYDALALGDDRLAFVIEVALLAEIGMIQPAELSEGERRRFLTGRLARCTMQVQSSRNAVAGLVELVRRLRDQRNVSKPSFEPTTTRGDTADPVLLVTAKGTRNNISPSSGAFAASKTRIDRPILLERRRFAMLWSRHRFEPHRAASLTRRTSLIITPYTATAVTKSGPGRWSERSSRQPYKKRDSQRRTNLLGHAASLS